MGIQERASRIEQLMNKILERDEYYTAFLEAAPWGILVVDESFRIVYINKAMEELSGYELSDIEGEHLHLLIPPEDRKAHTEHEKDYHARPRVRMGDHPFKPNVWNSDGERVPVEISLAPAYVRGETFYYASIRHRSTLPPTTLEDMSSGPGEYDIDELGEEDAS